MFRITDRAISPRKATFQTALKRLPAAHHVAQARAISHIHQQVTQAAEDAGLDSSPIRIGWHQSRAYLGIEHTPAGDQLFDHEFGTAEEGPSPTLRQAATAAHPAGSAIYHHSLRQRLGI